MAKKTNRGAGSRKTKNARSGSKSKSKSEAKSKSKSTKSSKSSKTAKLRKFTKSPATSRPTRGKEPNRVPRRGGLDELTGRAKRDPKLKPGIMEVGARVRFVRDEAPAQAGDEGEVTRVFSTGAVNVRLDAGLLVGPVPQSSLVRI